VVEKVNAKAKLGRDDALALIADVTRVLVGKGRKQLEFDVADGPPDEEELLAVMLGRTGNLRAPTIRIGDTLIVGFNEPMYSDFFDIG